MKKRSLYALVLAMVVILAAITVRSVFWSAQEKSDQGVASSNATASARSEPMRKAESAAVTNPTVSLTTSDTPKTNYAIQLHSILNDLYVGTNQHARMQATLARSLLASVLRTNRTFREWGTNATKQAVETFLRGNVPLRGISNSIPVEVSQIGLFPAKGMIGEARLGPLLFEAQGGEQVYVSMGVNHAAKQAEIYTGQDIARSYWTNAVKPLDRSVVIEQAANAFFQMTGKEITDFRGEIQISIPKIHAPVLDKVKLVGLRYASMASITNNLYPCVYFEYVFGPETDGYFRGKLVQSSPGKGEFVDLHAIFPLHEALWELANKFLTPSSPGWERQIVERLDGLTSYEDRKEVYRRHFSK